MTKSEFYSETNMFRQVCAQKSHYAIGVTTPHDTRTLELSSELYGKGDSAKAALGEALHALVEESWERYQAELVAEDLSILGAGI